MTLIRSCGICPSCASGAPVFCEATFPDRPRAPSSAARARSASTRASHRRLRRARRRPRLPGRRHPARCAVCERRAPRLRRASRASAPSSTPAGVEPGSSVVVVGRGGVGLNAVQGARLAERRGRSSPSTSPTAKLDAARAVRREPRGQRLDRGRARGRVRAHGRTARRLRLRHGRGAGGDPAGPVAGAAGRHGGDRRDAGRGHRDDVRPGLLAADGLRIVGSKMGSAHVAVDVPRLVEPLPGGTAEARRARVRPLPPGATSTRRSPRSSAATRSATSSSTTRRRDEDRQAADLRRRQPASPPRRPVLRLPKLTTETASRGSARSTRRASCRTRSSR